MLRATKTISRGASPSLVEVNSEDQVVTEAGESVGGWHGDDEGEDVIYEGVEGLWCVDSNSTYSDNDNNNDTIIKNK